MRTAIPMPTRIDEAHWLRLMQLISPGLPVGGFSYSQGLEWAVEAGWVRDEASLAAWVESLLFEGMAGLDVPLLLRMHAACRAGDAAALCDWSDHLLAARETRELREEERNRGRALASLLPELGVPLPADWLPGVRSTQLAGMARAAAHWAIPARACALGHLWSWLENTVLAGVKIIPLGQTAGQRLLAGLASVLPEVLEQGLAVADEAIGGSSPAQAIASSRHETQYTRIYRS